MTDIEAYDSLLSGRAGARFDREIAGLGVARHSDYRVVGLGREANGRQVVRLVDENGRTIRWDPQTARARHINVFNPENRDLAEGDRIQWRLVNRELDLRNAERGTVERLDGALATIRWDRDSPAGGLVRAQDLGPRLCRNRVFGSVKTYPRVFVLAPVRSPLVNAQNFYGHHPSPVQGKALDQQRRGAGQ
jgi:hypothetical protein